jgi:hypothetical protein
VSGDGDCAMPPGDVRAFLAAAGRWLAADAAGGGASGQAGAALRLLAGLSDAELAELAAEVEGARPGDVAAALGVFAEMFADPRLRTLDMLPAGADAAVTAALAADPAACRHVLAARGPAACYLCAAHPGEVRCPDCHHEHAAGHDSRHELTCDWCGAVCLHSIYPVPVALGSLLAVRDLAARRRFTAGPVWLAGLGACYRCHRDLAGQVRTITAAAQDAPRNRGQAGDRR